MISRLPTLFLCVISVLAFGREQPTSADRLASTESRIRHVETCLPPPVVVKGEPITCTKLRERMAQLHVYAVSIAVVHDGEIEWAKGYGVKEAGGSAVTPETLFQAGSISKPVAAIGALHLVQEGKLSLDSDVNATLTSWKVPSSPAAPRAIVTLRELLTHTAGFTVHGFPGYAAGETVPTLQQVLNGKNPANTPPIRLESVPGTKWNYSGGGFTVMQQLVIDITKQPYPEFLRKTVLVPIGMTRSTYDQPLPSQFHSFAAVPYNADGTPVKGGAHTYPEMAAAGLWTTPSDIARYIIEVQQSLRGKANHVLSQEMTKKMLAPGKGDWGLGVEIGGSKSNPYFTHGGVNEGYESLFAGYENEGEGAAIMTNAQGGSRLAEEIMSSIATAYHWPDFRPTERIQTRLDPALMKLYAGTYEVAPNFDVTVTVEGGQLMAQAKGQPKVPAYPESDKKFFLKVADVQLEFVPNKQGQISSLIIYQGNHETKAVKK